MLRNIIFWGPERKGLKLREQAEWLYIKIPWREILKYKLSPVELCDDPYRE